MTQQPSAAKPAWRPLLQPSQAVGALEVARDIAKRMRDPNYVERVTILAQEQTRIPGATYWLPYGLAQGWAGLAVMCGYLDACFPEEGWDVTGHTYLTLASRGAEGKPSLPSALWAGLSGLGFATWSLSRAGTRYQKLLSTIEQALIPQVVKEAQALSLQRNGVAVSRFDVISGLSGAGAYLLLRKDNPSIASAARVILEALIGLTHDNAGLPYWHSPPHTLTRFSHEQYPDGNLNCGLAHGIPGPLALLSLAYLDGIRVEGLPESIRRIVEWLISHRADDQWGMNWPSAVPLGVEGPRNGTRSAWCYGSPGVARSLFLAGKALEIPEYQDLAIAAMEAIYLRPIEKRNIESPTFCHGIAGLLHITLRFMNDVDGRQRGSFEIAAKELMSQLLDLYEPESLLGYRSVEYSGSLVDQPGLLNGAPGVAMVLLAASRSAEPVWDRPFLLA